MSYTVDDSTQASTPGALAISPQKYLDYIGAGFSQKLIYAALLKLPQGILFRFFRNNKIVFNWIKKAEHFKRGCVNPAIVLSVEKGLIATFTDLRASGDKPVPVIKISQEKLWLVRNEPLHNGKKIAAVAVYFEKVNDPYATAWADFDPKVPNCFTDDAEACSRLVNGLSESAWTCLHLGVAQLPAEKKVGLFRVVLDENLVNNA